MGGDPHPSITGGLLGCSTLALFYGGYSFGLGRDVVASVVLLGLVIMSPAALSV